MIFRKTAKELNGKTPAWFRQWHSEHYMPYARTTKRNEKWIYVILAAIIGSGVLANGGAETVSRLILSLLYDLN